MTQILGWPLLHFLWQGCVLGCAHALALVLLRNARPQARYALGCLFLLACLLWPAWGVWHQLAAPQELSLEVALALLQNSAAGFEFVVPDQSGLAARLQAYLPLIVTAWELGVSVMLARLCLGMFWVRQLRRADLAGAEWQARSTQMAYQLGIRRTVRLRVSSQLTSPLTVGCWRPLVLFPASVLSGLPSELIEALLAHELAHIRRWDYLVNLLQTLVEALLFYHPVVWWISRRIRVEREQIADDLAIQVLPQPQHLAVALQRLDLHLAQAQAHGLAQAAHGGHLLTRIKRLVRPGAQPWRWNMMLPVLALVFASALVWAYQQQEASPSQQAERAAKPLVEPRTEPVKVLADIRLASQHALVVDEASGQVLLEKNADSVVPIASISKLITAMVVLDAKPDLDESIVIDKDRSRREVWSKLPPGVILPRRKVLQLALMSSDNHAAQTLARTYPGGEANFIRAVQEKMQTLGLRQTSLEEPTGISSRNTSSAADMVKLAAVAASYPEIAQFTTESSDTVRIKGKPVEYQNTNQFVGKKGWDILLSKTGFTNEAGRCLLMRMKAAGRTVTLVLLNASDKPSRALDVMQIRHLLEKDTESDLK